MLKQRSYVLNLYSDGSGRDDASNARNQSGISDFVCLLHVHPGWGQYRNAEIVQK